MHLCTYSVVQDNKEAQVEVCTECGDKKVYKKIDERVDSQAYLKDHVRDFAQPGGRTDKIFKQYYGKPSGDIRKR